MFPVFIPKRRVQGKVVNPLGWPPLTVPRILLSSVDTCASMLGPLPRIPLWGSPPSRSPLAASNKTWVSYAHNYSNTIIALTSLNDILKSHQLPATLPAWFGVLQKLILVVRCFLSQWNVLKRWILVRWEKLDLWQGSKGHLGSAEACWYLFNSSGLMPPGLQMCTAHLSSKWSHDELE